MSNIGLVHGSIFFVIDPGKKPISSSTGTTGLVIIILSILFSLRQFTAELHAIKVFPVPAGPITTVILSSFLFKAFTYCP